MSQVTPNFDGLRVAAFESRRADDMERLIERHGGEPHVSPSMREIAVDTPTEAIDFANRLITGQIDIVIVMTGVGFQYLLQVVERHVDRERFLTSLADITTIARGPKAAVVMNKAGVSPTYRAQEPNTWREILQLIDESLPIANQKIALQEYGKTNPSMVAGLEARGAEVIGVKVYRWGLPEDAQPLEDNVKAIAAGERDVALFTSTHQIVNMIQVAEQLDVLSDLQTQLERMVVASIGPTTSEMLRDLDMPVDLEPEHSKMGQLVVAAAERSHLIRTRKKQISVALSGPTSNILDMQAPWYDSAFLKACRGEETDFTPVWLMRQAGRYMAEYREVRAKTTFLDLCKNPQLCSEVMCTAVERLGVDAAIIFSDLLPILEPMGMDLEFAKGEGPVIHNPVRDATDVDRVLELESVDSLHFVMETVKQTRNDLPADMPLIGFSGAPFTLVSYAMEGGSSRSYLHTKTLMYRDEGAWTALMQRFVRAIIKYLNAQIAAGAQCVQIFDSWVGCLGVQDYTRYVLPHMQEIIAGITPGVPVINFGTGNPALLPVLAAGGSQVVGIDWRIDLDQAWEIVGHDRSVQGNLDPVTLLADRKDIRRRVQEVLDQAGGRPGHIFNLGHGVLQQTPVDNAIALVDAVHELSQK